MLDPNFSILRVRKMPLCGFVMISNTKIVKLSALGNMISNMGSGPGSRGLKSTRSSGPIRKLS